ncbi:DUF2336 domain-containing protein [Roseibium limicola]|uniref:DUF2336 domain-containing protein n=1 Tax=Roseibium limicola TaxID=2816037 RepID=A0A939EJD7_9HYPH|nr:DUF2336 domain-containing protein [Roseibium limicola]MBO0343735.1 DUF2336 domain-containing protein [Roseibium limicola]
MTEAMKTELVNFKALDAEKNASRSSELARQVATLFSYTSDRCSAEQVDTYDKVLYRLVGMVEVEVRQFVAEKMSQLRRGPEETLRLLAGDQIEVAAPILRDSPMLRDLDLVSIADRQGDRHRMAIAQREVLSEKVTDVLVRRGDILVRRTVAKNAGALFNDGTLCALIHDAASDASMQEILSDRLDLADGHIHQLISVAGDKVRCKLLQRGRPEEASRLSEAVDTLALNMSNEYWLGRYDFETAQNRVLVLAKRGMINESALRRFANEDRFAEVVAAFAWISHCGLEEVRHWMVRPDPEPFLVVARANGLTSITVNQLLNIGPWRHRLSPAERRNAVAAFDRMSISDARQKLALWNGISIN